MPNAQAENAHVCPLLMCSHHEGQGRCSEHTGNLLQALFEVSCGDVSTRLGRGVAAVGGVARPPGEEVLVVRGGRGSIKVTGASTADVVHGRNVSSLLHLVLELFVEGEHARGVVDIVASTTSSSDEGAAGCVQRRGWQS